jgi:hypothetical protein
MCINILEHPVYIHWSFDRVVSVRIRERNSRFYMFYFVLIFFFSFPFLHLWYIPYLSLSLDVVRYVGIFLVWSLLYIGIFSCDYWCFSRASFCWVFPCSFVYMPDVWVIKGIRQRTFNCLVSSLSIFHFFLFLVLSNRVIYMCIYIHRSFDRVVLFVIRFHLFLRTMARPYVLMNRSLNNRESSSAVWFVCSIAHRSMCFKVSICF